jgi:hypothetical protein
MLALERLNEMIRVVCAISLLAALTAGCSQAYYIRSLDGDEFRAFDDQAAKKPCEVLLDDGVKHLAKKVKLAEDTTSWCDSKTGEEIRVSTERIQSVSFVYRGSGFFEGACLGFAIAGGIGAIVGLSAGEDDCSNSSELICFSRDEMLAILTIAFGTPGAVVGGIVGFVRGTKLVYYPFHGTSIDKPDEFGSEIHVDDGAVQRRRQPDCPVDRGTCSGERPGARSSRGLH